ncbi:MAG: hypothetical protein EBR15_10425, partial [Gammaproteobacteria bacterium]|nr:hypothetical protein [Gammaproteobacteria bacterium]
GAIKDCLRCGKCKPVCATHVPRANLLYSPRNKILATSLLIEAFLYEEQTRRGISLDHFDEFSDVAEHCTVCHKCLNPCPVDIDFGDVSIAMRNFLRRHGKNKFNPGTAASMLFLNATDPNKIKIVRKIMIQWGFRAQRFAYRIAKTLGLAQAQTQAPPATVGKPALKAQIIHFINKPMPGGLPKQASRALLGIEDARIVPIIRDPQKVNEDSDAVFYFPGCGSERLFSQVGLATQAMLYEIGAQCVLPPGYLCCGYPQTAAGEHDQGERSPRPRPDRSAESLPTEGEQQREREVHPGGEMIADDVRPHPVADLPTGKVILLLPDPHRSRLGILDEPGGAHRREHGGAPG